MKRPGVQVNQAGQSLVEFAISVPIILIIIFGFLGFMQAMQTVTELDAATTLAASAAIQFPVGEVAQSQAAARRTFTNSISGYGITGQAITCSGGNLSPTPSTTPVICHAIAKLDLGNTPLAVFWRGPLGLLTFTATGRADSSTNRSCAPEATNVAC